MVLGNNKKEKQDSRATLFGGEIVDIHIHGATHSFSNGVSKLSHYLFPQKDI